MKDIKIVEFKPLFTNVITTLDVYEEDLIENGILMAPKGCLKMIQRVVEVGDTVRNIKKGDLVLLNMTNYIVRKYKDNSLKEDLSIMEQELVYDFPKIVINNTLYGKFQDRDIDGVITKYDEVETEKAKPSLFS